jgi:hypothetical protein
VVERIKEVVLNRHSRYRKDIASASQNIKFQHRPTALPFLPPGIHKIITPPAIELVRQQHLLCQQETRKPYTGDFERTYGLPCSHSLQSLEETRTPLGLHFFKDDHWYYERRECPSIDIYSSQTESSRIGALNRTG